jgi:SAM-dependent methyltransferase
MIEEPPKVDTGAYTEWKHWGEEFGVLGAGDAAYFDKELRKVTSTRRIHDVLEIGFGNGRFLGYCKSKGWTAVGTELAPEQVATGLEAGYDVRSAEDVAALPDRSFDLIAAFDVLEHIPDTGNVAFLRELGGKLRQDGRLVLRYPNGDSWLGNPHQNGDPTHVTTVGYYKMEYLAASAGLKIVDYRAPARRGFTTSVIHGVHSLTAAPLVRLIAAVQKALYFPGDRFVLSSANVVCVLAPK